MPQFLNIHGFEAQQHQEELDWMLNKCKGKSNFIEIGTHKGGVFYRLCETIKGKRISIDFNDGPFVNREYKEMQTKLSAKFKNTFFINGNSHDYKILNELKTILKGELVDVLFIDGDHSAEGVQRDFEMYKQFVSDKGLIFFHDIIHSGFHAQHKCFVDKFWKDAPNPKENKCVSKEWGGIGCIENRKVDWKCYQIYFDAKSKKGLMPIFEPYNNSKDKSFFFFENNVILKIYQNIDKEKSDYIGTTSWKFAQKTQMGSVQFTELIESTNCNYDVLLFPHAQFLHENCMQRNKIYYRSIYQLMELFDKENILPFKICKDKWTCSYANYWIAKKSVYKDYCKRVLIPAMDAFKSNDIINNFVDKTLFNHGGKIYPITPFLLELLMGFYVNKFNITHKIITPDISTKLKIDEVLCKALKPNLLPEGKSEIIFKRKFAEELQAVGYVKIIEK